MQGRMDMFGWITRIRNYRVWATAIGAVSYAIAIAGCGFRRNKVGIT
ncbi:hypothetical protein PACILC2_33760 [Paenibacillus cisolokensis]|uniref:Uncharacterized protein n=1 Tax=Paenibacillus cisolokensis TaxID=1658519 RepID=A0ABQ4N979_9BACL|nr:hypothetical protein PACILC2_33760 [Paenibacillus cisolokensis]